MRQILVGVDGSPGSRAAVDYAAKLARQTGRRLLLAYVAEPLQPANLGPLQTDQELMQAAQKVLDGLAQRTALTGLGVDTAVLTGTVADTLADAARAEQVDFVVVGHRYRGIAASAPLSAVAERLVQISPKPLLVLPAPDS